MLLKLNRNLTRLPGDTFAVISHAGMAHFAGTGPNGMTCRSCAHWQHAGWHSPSGKKRGGLKDAQCGEYRRMTGSGGAAVPHNALACNRFEPREAPVPLQQPEA